MMGCDFTSRAAAVAVLVVSSLAAVSASAQAPAERDPRYKVFLASPISFYPDLELSKDGTPQFSTDDVARAIETYFAEDESRFVIIPSDAFFKTFSQSDARNSDVPALAKLFLEDRRATALMKDGVAALDRADLQLAETLLRKSARIYEGVNAGLLIPRDLARVYEYLALVLDEKLGREPEDEGLMSELHLVLKKLIRLDPARVMVYPFYSSSIEKAYREAREVVLTSRVGAADERDTVAARRYAKLVSADIVLWGFIVQRGDSLTLTLHMYRNDRAGETYPPEQLELGVGKGVQHERATRLASRFAACIEPLPVPKPVLVDREKGHLYLDTSFSFYVYLKPSDTAFNNFGISVAGNYLVSENFSLVGRVNFLTSGSDFEGNLRNEFSTIRTFLGGGISLKLKAFRPFITFAAEASRIGEFEITENFFCKVNINAPDCQAGDISVQDPGWLFGVNSQVGAGVKLYRELYLLVAGSFSFVVFPLSEPPLDFPVGFDVGLEYRF